jgi:hypothetical protein
VGEEQPLVSAGIDQDDINYGKGALALYLLQQRMGEERRESRAAAFRRTAPLHGCALPALGSI